MCNNCIAHKCMITITLEINRICNLRCSYCYIKEKNNEQMTFETAKNSVEFAIKRLIDMNHKKRVINIDFLGGEPLISFKLIKEIVTYCEQRKNEKKIKFYYTLTSNGTIFNEDIYSFLLRNKFSLKISLDGNEQVNDINRKDIKGQGSYNLVKENLKYLRRYEINTNKVVQISNVLTKNNYRHYYESVKFFVEELGFKYIDTGFDSNEKWSIKDIDELKDIFDNILKYYLECAKLGNEFVWGILEDVLDGMDNVFRLYSCGAGIISFYVSFDGKYYLCPAMLKKQYCLGSVNECETETKFMKFVKKYDQNLKTDSLKCSTCKIEPYCMNRECIAMNIVEEDFMSSIALCYKNQILYEIVKHNYYEIHNVRRNSLFFID